MAHQVYKINGEDSMAYTGKTPWHGLGQELIPGASLEVWAKTAHLDWEVERSEVHYDIPGFRDKPISFDMPNRHVLYRSDTMEPLAVVSDRFKVVQPEDILEFYRDLVEKHGFELETAGSLDNGKRVWALAKNGKHADLPGNDRIESRLLLATAYDGSLSTTAKWVTIRVVCNNTLDIANKENGLEIKCPHNAIFNPSAVKMDLGLYDEAWTAFVDSATKMTDTALSEEELVKFMVSIFHNPANVDKDGKEDFSDVPKRTLHKLLDLTLEGKGADMKSAKGTLWGAVNAVTEYYDHHAGRTKDTGLKNAWFGQANVVKNRTYRKAVQLMETTDGNTVEVEVDIPEDEDPGNGSFLDDIIAATPENEV